jgi:hypothetical protein
MDAMAPAGMAESSLEVVHSSSPELAAHLRKLAGRYTRASGQPGKAPERPV